MIGHREQCGLWAVCGRAQVYDLYIYRMPEDHNIRSTHAKPLHIVARPILSPPKTKQS